MSKSSGIKSGGHGGARPGAGRKPKPAHLRAIDGGAGHRPAVTPSVSAGVAPIEEFDPPDHLSPEVLAIWKRLAPHAYKAQTLTPRMAEQFEILCENLVTMRLLARTEAGGSNHRGMIQRVDAELLRFDLAPIGKPVLEAGDAEKAAPASPLSRFLKRG